MIGMRIDKWLWATRFFKSRSLASHACDLGRIMFNEQPVKAAREVRVGDLVHVKTAAGDFQIEVLQLSEMRGPAAVAQTLYRETAESKALRLKMAEERRITPHLEMSRDGKLSKRDRRKLDEIRGRERF